MLSRHSLTQAIIALFFALLAASLFHVSPAFAVTCTVPGTVEITTLTRAIARAAGIPDNQECWNPNDPTIGMAAGDAKRYLNDLPKRCTTKGPGCQAPPDLDHIMKLNDQLAICATKFFKSYIAQYGQLQMSSAFRCGPRSPGNISCDRNENKDAGGATDSNHQLGMAIDVNPKGSGASYETMWSYASNNPKFGICFPYLGGDRPHITLAGSGSGEAARCASQGVTKPCDGMAFIPVAASPYTPTPTPGIQQPTAALSNMLRTMMMPTPQPIIPQQPVAPYYDPTQYFTPPPPYPTSTPNPPPPAPVPPVTPSPTPPPPPPSSTSTTPTTTITLINGINNPVGIDVGTKPKIVGTSTINISSIPQTTFRSDDLNRSPMQLGLFTNRNPLFAILEALKRVLLKILTVIRPFGRPQN